MEDNKNIPEKNTADKTAPSTPPVKKTDDSDSSEKSGKDKRKLTLVIAGGILGLFVFAFIILAVVGSVKSGNNGETTLSASENLPAQTVYGSESAPFVQDTSAAMPSENEPQAALQQTAEPATAAKAEPTAAANTGPTVPTATQPATQAPVTETTEPFTINGLEPFTKSGDNIISDSPDNEFIKIVADKYSVDPALLVAIYAVPDKGNNFVLEFNGTKDSDGKIIRSPDTLYRVHLVDLKRNISTTTGKVRGNIGVSFAEGILTFETVKGIIMPQHPDYFTGVEQE